MASSPQRVPAGSPNGGRFAASAHAEPDIALPQPEPSTTDSQFVTAGPARKAAAPPYMHNQAYFRERREALSHLHAFGERDLVVVTDEHGREHPGVVLRPRRSDGEYGSPESWTVPVSLVVGRYTFDVTAHRLAMGELGIRRADLAEQQEIQARLEQARLDNAACRRNGCKTRTAGSPPSACRWSVPGSTSTGAPGHGAR
jgi:hypothetical protein